MIINKGKVKKAGNRTFYLIESSYRRSDKKFCSINNSTFLKKLNCSALRLGIPKLSDLSLEDMLFFDVESCGLSHESPLFLIGTLSYNKKWKINEIFARDYSEEKAALQYFNDFAKNFKAIVSFNGTSYDLPLVKSRSFYNNLKFEFSGTHIDLLPLMRKMGKSHDKKLPDYRLSTIEKIFLGKYRADSIKGENIEKIYKNYIFTGEKKEINSVIEKNMDDLTSPLHALYFCVNNL